MKLLKYHKVDYSDESDCEVPDISKIDNHVLNKPDISDDNEETALEPEEALSGEYGRLLYMSLK